MAESEPKRGNWLGLLLLLVVVCIAPFVPIAVSFIEWSLFKSGYSEHIWRALKLYDLLTAFYHWLGIL